MISVNSSSHKYTGAPYVNSAIGVQNMDSKVKNSILFQVVDEEAVVVELVVDEVEEHREVAVAEEDLEFRYVFLNLNFILDYG